LIDMRISNINKAIDIFGVEDIMWIQWDAIKMQ